MFWDNYYNLCLNNGISPNAAAKEMKISSGAVTEWKKGRVPQMATIKKIADYFGVTVDYLLNESPTQEFKKTTSKEKKMFWETFLALCNRDGIKPTPLVKSLGLPSGSVTDWKKGATPRDTTLIKIANYFDVPVSALTENSPAEQPFLNQDEHLTEQEKTLLRFFRETTEEGRMRMIQAVLTIYDQTKEK